MLTKYLTLDDTEMEGQQREKGNKGAVASSPLCLSSPRKACEGSSAKTAPHVWHQSTTPFHPSWPHRILKYPPHT